MRKHGLLGDALGFFFFFFVGSLHHDCVLCLCIFWELESRSDIYAFYAFTHSVWFFGSPVLHTFLYIVLFEIGRECLWGAAVGSVSLASKRWQPEGVTFLERT
ncbi:hypothetical protein QBC32DRAFT_55004 [Pseudoneurospora amorphoporcata]|uniref:Uncharacterized protein n=1 Tax=Pseudoneurospora amorphoporcata TaxID=241081 RepID=A0AAN6NPB6_9PEZI|nr:hypothetical protein QBC32DRAFT_55004 [Pseudoneurospora amorphoporcata]